MAPSVALARVTISPSTGQAGAYTVLTVWTEVATGGQDADSLEHPAPTVTLTAAAGSGQDGDRGPTPPGRRPQRLPRPDWI